MAAAEALTVGDGETELLHSGEKGFDILVSRGPALCGRALTRERRVEIEKPKPRRKR